MGASESAILVSPTDVDKVKVKASPEILSAKARSLISSTKAVVIPIATLDRKECEEKQREYVRTTVLGRGSDGTIYAACKNATDCKYAVKASNYDGSPHAKKDVYFLQVLAPAKLHGQYIVPRLFDAWICEEGAQQDRGERKRRKETEDGAILYLVMDRWDGDMASLMKKQGDNLKLSQLIRMFGLAVALGMLGVLHSDLKIDQYLHRNNGAEMVVSDFGFSGTSEEAGPDNLGHPFESELGWPSTVPRLKCPAAFTPIPPCALKKEEPPAPMEVKTGRGKRRVVEVVANPTVACPTRPDPIYPAWINVMQLEAFLLEYNPNLQILDDRTETPIGTFAGFEDLIRTSPQNPCPGYDDKRVEDLVSKRSPPLLRLSFQALLQDVQNGLTVDANP